MNTSHDQNVHRKGMQGRNLQNFVGGDKSKSENTIQKFRLQNGDKNDALAALVVKLDKVQRWQRR